MPKKRNLQDSVEACGVFKDLDIFVFPALIAPKRLSLFESHIRKGAGKWLTIRDVKNGQKPSCIVVDESLAKDEAKLRALLRASAISVSRSDSVVSTKWISSCLKSGVVEPTEQFDVFKLTADEEKQPAGASSSQKEKLQNFEEGRAAVVEHAVVSNCVGSDDEVAPKRSKVEESAPSTSKNDLIVNELQKLADAFQSKGDTWRAHGYTKAISAIRRHGQPISSYEDAVKLPGIGSKMAEKVWEILECGSLRKVAEVCSDEKTRTLELFTGVWGAGPSTAESWYQQGYRSLEDLKQTALTKQQQVGLKHYDEFADRMSREEVELIGNKVTSLQGQL